MAFAGTGKIWMNGKLVDWKDATIHVASHVIHYGSGVFEGARCYDTPKGSAILRLDAHMARLVASAKIYRMDSPLRPRPSSKRRSLETDSRQRLQGLLHPPADVSRLQRARRQPAALPGRCGHHGLGMGHLSRGRRARKGRRRLRQLLEPHGAQHVPVAREDERQLRERRAHPHGSGRRTATAKGSRSTRSASSAKAAARTSSSFANGAIYTPPLSASILPGITRDMVMHAGARISVTA